jgi:starch synthase
VGRYGKFVLCAAVPHPSSDHTVFRSLKCDSSQFLGSNIHPLSVASWRYPGKVVVHVGHREQVAHLLHAGSDIQPTRFEPCGLMQLFALRYGAIPIVARTGGLAETIIVANEAAMAARVATCFQFQPGSVEEFYHAIDRALIGFQPLFWRRSQTQAM